MPEQNLKKSKKAKLPITLKLPPPPPVVLTLENSTLVNSQMEDMSNVDSAVDRENYIAKDTYDTSSPVAENLPEFIFPDIPEKRDKMGASSDNFGGKDGQNQATTGWLEGNGYF